MAQAPLVANAARVVRILHGALMAGLMLVGMVFALVLRLDRSDSRGRAPTIGLAFAVLGVVLLAVGGTILRPKIPPRRPDQSADAYWAGDGARGPAIVLWCVVQAAGLMALLGYFQTGAAASLAVGVLALGTQFLFRPSRLEREGAA